MYKTFAKEVNNKRYALQCYPTYKHTPNRVKSSKFNNPLGCGWYAELILFCYVIQFRCDNLPTKVII